MKIKFSNSIYAERQITEYDPGFLNTHKVMIGARIFDKFSLWLCHYGAGGFFKLKGDAETFTIDVRWLAPKQKGFRAIELYQNMSSPPAIIYHARRKPMVTEVDTSISAFIRTITKETNSPTIWVKLVEQE